MFFLIHFLSCKQLLQYFNSYIEGSFLNTSIALITICATFIVGFQIYNSIEYKNRIEKLEDERSKFEKDKLELDRRLVKTDGDHSRMIATFLAETKRPIWAIGWISKSIRTYGNWIIKLNEDQHFGNDALSHNTHFMHVIKLNTELLLTCVISFHEILSKNKETMGEANVIKIISKTLSKELNYENGNDVLIRSFKDFMCVKLCEQKQNMKIFRYNGKEAEIIETFFCLMHSYLTHENIMDDVIFQSEYIETEKKQFEDLISQYSKNKSTNELFEEWSDVCNRKDEDVNEVNNKYTNKKSGLKKWLSANVKILSFAFFWNK